MDVLQEAIDAVAQYGSIAEAARQLKIPRKTLSGRYNKAVDKGYVSGTPSLSQHQKIGLDAKLKAVAREKRELQRKYDELLKMFDGQEQRTNTIQLLTRNLAHIDPEPIKVVQSGKQSESTAVICCSDLHYEETIDPKTVDDLNEYNITIAKQRFHNVFRNGLKLIEMCRSKSDINTLVLWLGGDLISGYIHEELMEGNALSPVEASIDVYKMCVSAINFLMEHGNFKKIIVMTNVGNHGRTTEKIRIATSVENSFEWLIYNFLMSYYEDSGAVEFKLSRGYFNYLDIYGYKLRFHHGNYVRYAGGIGGITIPLNKAVAEWNKARRADIDIFGHWHQRLSAKNLVGNGSIIGYSPYALSIKAPFEKPQQTFFLVHPKHGKTVEAPIWVE